MISFADEVVQHTETQGYTESTEMVLRYWAEVLWTAMLEASGGWVVGEDSR